MLCVCVHTHAHLYMLTELPHFVHVNLYHIPILYHTIHIYSCYTISYYINTGDRAVLPREDGTKHERGRQRSMGVIRLAINQVLR